MATLKFNTESARTIDKEKIVIESKLISSLKRVFRDIADDAAKLYIANDRLDAKDIATNYKAEILVEVRKALRSSIKKFGYSIRDNISKKHNLNFAIENKIKLIDLELKKTEKIVDEDLEENVEEINNEFNKDATLFIANESEKQTDFITDTNEKQLEKAVAFGGAVYTAKLSELQKEKDIITQDFLRASGTSQEAKLERRLRRVNNAINETTNKRPLTIAEGLRKKIIDESQSRSELIASQNVGLGESWARNREAEIINNANLITEAGQTIKIKKQWVSILDMHTRPAHRSADGQRVDIDASFLVDGESLKFPRDPNSSAKNIINCRCVSIYTSE